jgi:hypothetical protein
MCTCTPTRAHTHTHRTPHVHMHTHARTHAHTPHTPCAHAYPRALTCARTTEIPCAYAYSRGPAHTCAHRPMCQCSQPLVVFRPPPAYPSTHGFPPSHPSHPLPPPLAVVPPLPTASPSSSPVHGDAEAGQDCAAGRTGGRWCRSPGGHPCCPRQCRPRAQHGPPRGHHSSPPRGPGAGLQSVRGEPTGYPSRRARAGGPGSDRGPRWQGLWAGLCGCRSEGHAAWRVFLPSTCDAFRCWWRW